MLVLRTLARRSKPRPKKQPSSNARSSPTSARSYPTARRAWRRPDRRRAADRHLVTPRPRPLRSRLRTTRRRRAPPSLKRSDDPPPAQPRRRPPTQPRPAHRHPPPPPARPGHQGLHRPPHRRRQDPPRSHPAPQALPRPPPLPRHAERDPTHHLTVIGASFPHTWGTRRSTPLTSATLVQG